MTGVRWRSLAVLLLAGVVWACSPPPEGPDADGGPGDDGGSDTGVDTLDRDTGTLDTGPDPDSNRQPLDADTSWDPGLSDADADGSSVPLALKRVVPPSGPVKGGNRVRIVGEGFSDDLTVYFGSNAAEFDLSGGALVGEAPRGNGPGAVAVKVVAPDGTTAAIPDGYEYVAGVRVDSVSPKKIPVEGGTQVTIEGRGFRKPTAVSFDGESALRVRRIDATELRAVAPPGDAGPADVRITTPTESAVVEGAVEYVEPLEVTSVRPASGPTGGGTRVTVSVESLGPKPRVEFGSNAASVVGLDRQAGEITVTTPPHAKGLTDVSVRTGGDAAVARDAFLYRDKSTPTLAGLKPKRGPASGGTVVDLVGAGLGASGLQVEFGGSAGQVLANGATWARVETPAGSVGTVDVVARDGNGQIGRLAGAFEYLPELEVDRVRPSSGPSKGGTSVTIEGVGFQNADAVYFGGLPASYKVQSDTTITATAPPHGGGPVDVRVERNGLEASLDDAFTYQTPLEVWGFSPVRGAVAGGTYVHVRGRGFSGTVAANVDGTAAKKVRRIDRNNLYLYTPPHAVGEASVEVRANSSSATAPYPFEYFNPANRYGGASGGEVRGAVNVTVLSDGGGPIQGAYVQLSTRSDAQYSGLTNRAGQVTLSGPDVLGPQTVTATAKGFSSTTVRSINSENLTLYLTKLNPSGGGGGGGGGQPPSAVVKGEVRSPYKLADPDVDQTYDMAVVRTTKDSVYGRRPDPGSGSVVVGDGPYEITSRIGDLAVVAFCGVYDQSTDEFEPQYIGVERYVNISDGETHRADLVCDIPLDRSVQVKIQNPIFAPTGPDTNVARVFWNFGFEGVIEAPSVGSGAGSLLTVPDQPPLKDALSDVELIVRGGSFTGQNSAPSSQTRKEGVTSMQHPVVLPPLVDVPEPVEPKPGGTLTGHQIRFQAQGPYFPEMYSIYLINQQGRPIWHYLMDGSRTKVELPEFPDFSYLPRNRRPSPYHSGQTFILIYGIDAPGSSFDEFTYRTLSFSQWRGYSLRRWSFQMK